MLAVVIVTYSAEAAMLEACVASVVASGDADHVIVVDNGGGAVADHDIELIRMPRNVGFGGGANAGFRRATELGAVAVALLNDDIEVDAGWLGPLHEALLEDAALGAVQPKLLLAGSVPARVNSVGVSIGRDGAGTDVGYGEEDGSQFAKTRRIESFTGGAVLFRANFLKNTGGFDESYFLYYEDVDLGLRGQARGWRFRCACASRVRHRGCTSTERAAERTMYLRERNRLWILFGHRPVGHIGRGVWLSVRRLRHHPRSLHARALIAGLAAAPRLIRSRLQRRA